MSPLSVRLACPLLEVILPTLKPAAANLTGMSPPRDGFFISGVTGSLKGTFDLLVAFGTLWRPCQCKAWIAHLRAKSQHPRTPGWLGRDGVGSQAPGLCLPTHWPPPVLLSKTACKEWQGVVVRRQPELNRNDFMLPLSECGFTEDVRWVFWWW